MNVPTVAVIVAADAGLIVAMLTAVVSIPRSLRAMYRLELWALRDEYVDKLTAGEISSGKHAVALLNVMEYAIKGADQFTITRVLLNYLESRTERERDDFLPNGIPDVELLRDYRARLTSIRVKWVLRTSPLGWLSPVWFGPALYVYRLLFGKPLTAPLPARRDVVSKRVEDQQLRPAMKLERIDPGMLSHCV